MYLLKPLPPNGADRLYSHRRLALPASQLLRNGRVTTPEGSFPACVSGFAILSQGRLASIPARLKAWTMDGADTVSCKANRAGFSPGYWPSGHHHPARYDPRGSHRHYVPGVAMRRALTRHHRWPSCMVVTPFSSAFVALGSSGKPSSPHLSDILAV